MYIKPLDEIKQRIGDGQERGLAAPDDLSIDDIYKERVPLIINGLILR